LKLSYLVDLPDCGSAIRVLTNVSLSTSDSAIARKSSTRSLLECVSGCWKDFPLKCVAVFESSQGNSLVNEQFAI